MTPVTILVLLSTHKLQKLFCGNFWDFIFVLFIFFWIILIYDTYSRLYVLMSVMSISFPKLFDFFDIRVKSKRHILELCLIKSKSQKLLVIEFTLAFNLRWKQTFDSRKIKSTFELESGRIFMYLNTKTQKNSWKKIQRSYLKPV